MHAFTHVLRQAKTRHLLCLYNVQHRGRGWHWMLLGVSASLPTLAAPKMEIRSTATISSYPAPLLAFLRED